MKNKRMVAKSEDAEQSVAVAAVPLGKDEVIDRLEEAFDKLVHLMNGEVGDEIPILLFVERASSHITNSSDDDLMIEGSDSIYCSPLAAVQTLAQHMAGRLHRILEEADSVHMEAYQMMCDYRKANQKIPISASVEAK